MKAAIIQFYHRVKYGKPILDSARAAFWVQWLGRKIKLPFGFVITTQNELDEPRKLAYDQGREDGKEQGWYESMNPRL